MAISHINLTKEIPTLISFARNDGWNYNTKIYISKKICLTQQKKAAGRLYSKKPPRPSGEVGANNQPTNQSNILTPLLHTDRGTLARLALT